jgi:hypothetical protein
VAGYAKQAAASPVMAELLMTLTRGPGDKGGRLVGSLLRSLDGVAAPMTPAEFDQASAGIFLMMAEEDHSAVQASIPAICAAAERYSQQLLLAPDSDEHVMLHEGAILLANKCGREWAAGHRLKLARGGVEPGAWISLVMERVSQRKARANKPRTATASN